MAIFHSTICKKIRKSYGTVTMCRLGGQNILRDKVTEVHNPKTLPQQMQRRRHATLVELSNVFCQATYLGFPRRPKKQSPDNQFVQLNHRAVQVSEELEVSVDYKQIIVSKGNRELPAVTVASTADPAGLAFTWAQEDFVRHAALDDRLYAVVLEQNLLRVKVFVLGERKDTESVNISLPSGWETDQLMVWVFMLSRDKQNASTSRWLEIKPAN